MSSETVNSTSSAFYLKNSEDTGIYQIWMKSYSYENNLMLRSFESPTKTFLVTLTNVMHGQSHLPFGVILNHKTIVHYVPLSFSFFLVVFLLESEKQEKNQSGRDWRQRSKWSRSPSRGDRPRTNQDSFKSGARSMFWKYFLE